MTETPERPDGEVGGQGEAPRTEGAAPSWRRADSKATSAQSQEESSFDQTLVDPDSKVEGVEEDVEGLESVGGQTLVSVPGERPPLGPNIPDVELSREIGRGGMGVVYEGRQGYLDRAVAVKVLTHSGGGEEFTLRFQREAKILASLSHPNIVACYSAGVSEEGEGYLVMEFVDGPTLHDWIMNEAPLSPNRAVEVCRDIARALECAYRSGIIHRDVKPPNVLLKRIPDGDPEFPFQPLLADLGLARASGEFSGSSGVAMQELTVQGTVMGSPPTMAPEQFDDPDAVDFRTDIYGLGCVLYHCLTGKLAFPQESLTSLIARKTKESPPDPQELQAGIPPAICALVRDMLRRYPGERPASYAELLERMAGPFEEAPTAPARSRSAGTSTKARSGSRSKLPLLVGGALLLAVAGGLALRTFSSPEEPEARVAEVSTERSDAPEIAQAENASSPVAETDPVASNEAEAQSAIGGAEEIGDATSTADENGAASEESLPATEENETESNVETQPVAPEPQLVLPDLEKIAKGTELFLLGQEFGVSPLAAWTTELGEAEAWSALDEGHGAQALVFEGKSAASTPLPAPPWELSGSFELKRPGGRSEPDFALALLLEEGVGLALRQKRDGDEIAFLGERVQRAEAGGFETAARLFDLTLSGQALEEYRAVTPVAFRISWDSELLTISWRLQGGEDRVTSWEAHELIPWGAPVAFALQLESGAAVLRDLVVSGR